MWLQVWFYSIAITVVAYIIKPELIQQISLKRVIFPVATNFYWYFTAYTGVFFVMPWINMFVRERSQSEMNRFMLLLLGVFSFYASIAAMVGDPFKISAGYSFIWLMLLYLVGAWIKKSDIIKKIKVQYAFIAIGMNVGITCFTTLVFPQIKPMLISICKSVDGRKCDFSFAYIFQMENRRNMGKNHIIFHTSSFWGVFNTGSWDYLVLDEGQICMDC